MADLIKVPKVENRIKLNLLWLLS